MKMLRLQLVYFRSWDSLDLEIPLGKITLLKGDSGAGKTTILQSIIWCLYGHLRKVTPLHNEKAKTKVVITLPNVTIERSKNPNRLLLTDSTGTYEDKVAQSLIDKMFGSKDVWLASSYIGQSMRNTFLTSTNSSKMELLNIIAFQDEDPTIYIQKILSALADKNSQHKLYEQVFNKNNAEFAKEIQGVDFSHRLTPESYISLEQELQSKKNTLQQLTTQHTVSQTYKKHLEMLESQLSNLVIPSFTTKLDLTGMIPNFDIFTDNLDEIDNCIKDLQNAEIISQKVSDLRDKIVEIESKFRGVKNYTEKDYQDAISQEALYQENIKLFQQYSIPYNTDSLQTYRKNLQNHLDSQERLLLDKTCLDLESELKSIQNSLALIANDVLLPQYKEVELTFPNSELYSTSALEEQKSSLLSKKETLKAEIAQLHACKDIITCPKCNSNLRVHYDKTQIKLNLSDASPVETDKIVSKENELKVLDQEIAKLTQEINRIQKSYEIDKSNYFKALEVEKIRKDQFEKQYTTILLENQRRNTQRETLTQKQNSITTEYEHKKKLRDSLNPVDSSIKLLSEREIQQVQQVIGATSGFKIIEPANPSISVIKADLEQQLIQQQLSSLKLEYSKLLDESGEPLHLQHIKVSINKLQIHRKDVVQHLENMRKTMQTKEALQAQIDVTKEKILPDCSKEITSLQKEIDVIESRLSVARKIADIEKKREKLLEERDNLIQVTNDITHLKHFHDIAVDQVCAVLAEIVDTINTSISNVCSSLFGKHIDITLSLLKELKSKQSIKHEVNFNISYNGGDFDNIDQLSGGEGDRASIALTLALSRLSSSPIILFDEALASLNVDLKETVVDTIRETSDKTVIVVMHDGVEGIFDNIIDANTISSSTQK